MYTLRQAFIEICKIFSFSTVCSTVFALMIYRASASSNVFISFVLVIAAALLFLYLCYANWSKLYERTYSPSEYYIPAISAILVYAAVSSLAYLKRFILYMWIFMPTRFLELKLNSDYAYLSVLTIYLALLTVIFIIPVMQGGKD